MNTRVIFEAEKMIEVVLLSRLHDRSIVHCLGDKILLARGGHRKAFACPVRAPVLVLIGLLTLTMAWIFRIP